MMNCSTPEGVAAISLNRWHPSGMRFLLLSEPGVSLRSTPG
ncbi:MAG: hypothetical protein ACKV2Q_08295 [Planctomycetaceae bacterium]